MGRESQHASRVARFRKRGQETYPQAPIGAPATNTPRPVRRGSVLSGIYRLEPAVGVPHRLGPVRMHDDLGAVIAASSMGGAVGVIEARGGGSADRGGLGGCLPLRCARR